MDPSRYAIEVAKFEEALALDPAELPAWLSALDASDPELARTVERMLQADAAASEVPRVAEQIAADLVEDDLGAGAVVGGFVLKERVGIGGMAAVWRAFQDRPRRAVALKILHPWQRDALVLDRFRFEADALARLRHPAFPEVYAVGEEGGRPWMAMELVDGAPLHRWLADALPGPGARLRVLIALVEAVAGLHALGLVHRDLKPENVLIDEAGGPRVIDLGVASGDDDEAQIRQMAVGTPGWSSPEQTTGVEATPASDVYALGAIGRLLLLGARGGPLPAGVPADVVPILARATAAQAVDRYPDAAALADDLRRARDGLPVSAADTGLAYRLQRWAGRNRRALAAAAVVVGVVQVASATTAIDRWLRDAAALAAAQDGLASMQKAGDRNPKVALAELQSFLQLPESAPVAWEGWMAAAHAAAAARAADAELDALGHAWSLSADLAQEGAVLDRAVDALLKRWSFRAALAAGRHAGDRLPEPARAQLRLLDGDLAGALDLMPADDPRRPLVSALAHGTRARAPSAVQATTAGADGPLFALDAAHHELVQLARTPDLTPLRRWPTADLQMTWPRAHLAQVQGAVHLLAAHSEDPAVLQVLRLDPQGLTPLGALHEPRVQRIAVDGSTSPAKVLLGTGPYTRHLVEVDSTDWRPVSPATYALESDVMDVEVAELDDDAPAEVLVGLGPWWAYGVARYDRGADGVLAMTARATLGFVHDVATLRTPRGLRVAALKSDRYPEPTVFGDEQPFGPHPPGLYLLNPSDLSIDAHTALPSPLGEEGAEGYVYLHVGDFDGDGLDDIAVWVDLSNPGHAWLLRQLPEGGFAGFMVADWRPVLATDLDGDGDDELVIIQGAGDGTLWVLGAGDEPAPREPSPEDNAEAPPDSVRSDAAREAWARAEVLRELGLGRQAADALLRAADHAPAADANRLAVRAGALAEATHDLPAALGAYRRGLGSADVDAATGLHRVARAMVDLDAAWLAARRLTELRPDDQDWQATWQAEVNRLAALRTEPTVTWRADGEGLADEVWQLPRPASVRRTHAGLDVALLGGQSTVLSLPLRGDGARVGMRLALDLETLDPGVELHLDIVGPFGLLVGVHFGRDGRTGMLGVRCRAAGVDDPASFPADEFHGTAITVDVQRVAEGVACRFDAGGETIHRWAASQPVDLTPSAFVVRDPAAGDYGLRMSTLARLVLREVTLDGVEVAPGPPDTATWQVVAGGAPTDCGGPDSCLVAALRREHDLREAVAAVLAQPHGEETLRVLLRVGTPAEVERLRLATSAERFADLITGAWSGTLFHAPPELVLSHLDQPWLSDIAPTTEPRVLLLGRVGSAMEGAGRYVRAAELFTRVTQPDQLRLVKPMARLDLLVGLARAEIALGNTDAAADALGRALLATPTPEVLYRRLAVEPKLAALLP